MLADGGFLNSLKSTHPLPSEACASFAECSAGINGEGGVIRRWRHRGNPLFTRCLQRCPEGCELGIKVVQEYGSVAVMFFP